MNDAAFWAMIGFGAGTANTLALLWYFGGRR